MAVQSLYRRYRPRRFGDVRGQEHVVRVLGNAVREGTVSHAYLFSGPRGTGKTSTARILAKALNCTASVDGEPCCTCESCVAVEAGTSLDVVELDAASNRGVEDMRDLVARVALGTSGRTKLYILDEVHMLTKDASNTLLKTLEEPPGHVVFVLATTEPEKVLPTIRSRTQHLEFRLLPAAVLVEHLRWVASDAGLALDDEAIEAAVRRGAGSARDSLSALDQIVAAGGAAADEAPLDEIIEAICEEDPGRALAAVARAADAGREPRQLASGLLAHLRDAFLSLEAPDLVALPDAARERVAAQAARLGRPGVLAALTAVGEAAALMRDAPDPRVPLEVALVRVTRRADTTVEALAERVARLERAVRDGGAGSPGAPARTAGGSGRTAGPAPDPPARTAGGSGRTAGPAPDPPPAPRAATGRPALGGVRRSRSGSGAGTPTGAGPGPAPGGGEPAGAPPARGAAPAHAGSADLPTRDELTVAWADHIVGSLRPATKARYLAGRFVEVRDGAAVFALPNQVHRDQCETRRADVEEALAAHFGRPVPLRLVVDAGETGAARPDRAATGRSGEDAALPAAPAGGPAEGGEPELVDVSELTDAPDQPADGVARLAEAFPGAEVVEDPPSTG